MHRQTPVAAQAVAERMAALRDLAAEKSRRFRTSLIGRELPGITLHTTPALVAQGRSPALTDNYLPVELRETWPANQLVRLHVTGVASAGVVEAATKTWGAVAGPGDPGIHSNDNIPNHPYRT